MPVLKELLEYQKEDGALRAIEQELLASEERKKFMQAKKFMEAAREKLEAQEKRAIELKAMRDSLVMRVEELTHTVAEYAELEEMVEGGGDIAFYKKNAQAQLDKLRAIKGELNKLLSEANAVAEEYRKLKEQTIVMQKQYKEYSEKFKALRNSRAEEVKKLNDRLESIAKKIDPSIMERYQQKRKERIFPILVPLTGDFCMCGFEFPKYHQSELAGGNVVECENCHRFIYKP